ncbi:hypothetical protein VE04_06069 [Pseudogymnoascus sp. 24MN13]|nr:hypothetical protein VE04_06069 [Pseudogymnoascus sp. 24MN13]
MSKRTSAGAKAAKTEDVVDKQTTLLSSETGHFSLVRALHLADLITELNGMCGLGNLWAALALMPLGLFFDFFDGKVARWRRKSSLMGQELDSLADLISFGVAPAAAAFAIGFRTPLDHFILAFFVLCGLTRLARFNVTVANVPKDATGKSQDLEGTPIPTTLSIVGLMAYWVGQGWLHGELPFGTVLEGSAMEFHPVLGLFVISGCLMTNGGRVGRGVESAILSKHFKIEVCSIDVQTLRIDRFNEGSPIRCILVYSGIHYDTIVQSPSDPPHTIADNPPELDKRVWDSYDDDILIKAQQLCKVLQGKHYFTNVGEMAIRSG